MTPIPSHSRQAGYAEIAGYHAVIVFSIEEEKGIATRRPMLLPVSAVSLEHA